MQQTFESMGLRVQKSVGPQLLVENTWDINLLPDISGVDYVDYAATSRRTCSRWRASRSSPTTSTSAAGASGLRLRPRQDLVPDNAPPCFWRFFARRRTARVADRQRVDVPQRQLLCSAKIAFCAARCIAKIHLLCAVHLCSAKPAFCTAKDSFLCSAKPSSVCSAKPLSVHRKAIFCALQNPLLCIAKPSVLVQRKALFCVQSASVCLAKSACVCIACPSAKPLSVLLCATQSPLMYAT